MGIIIISSIHTWKTHNYTYRPACARKHAVMNCLIIRNSSLITVKIIISPYKVDLPVHVYIIAIMLTPNHQNDTYIQWFAQQLSRAKAINSKTTFVLDNCCANHCTSILRYRFSYRSIIHTEINHLYRGL